MDSRVEAAFGGMKCGAGTLKALEGEIVIANTMPPSLDAKRVPSFMGFSAI